MEKLSLDSENSDGAGSSNPEMDSTTLSVDVPAGIEPEKSKKGKEVPTVAVFAFAVLNSRSVDAKSATITITFLVTGLLT